MRSICLIVKVDLSNYRNEHSLASKCGRLLWRAIWLILFRPSPRCCFAWRNFLLRCFRAQIGKRCVVYPSSRIWAPWNLGLGEQSALGEDVDCYCVDKIIIGDHVTVSQYAFLCTAGHDISTRNMRLVTAPIKIGSGAWICANAFVAPGVTIGEGAVVAACGVVTKDVSPWVVVGGNPASFIKDRVVRAE